MHSVPVMDNVTKLLWRLLDSRERLRGDWRDHLDEGRGDWVKFHLASRDAIVIDCAEITENYPWCAEYPSTISFLCWMRGWRMEKVMSENDNAHTHIILAVEWRCSWCLFFELRFNCDWCNEWEIDLHRRVVRNATDSPEDRLSSTIAAGDREVLGTCRTEVGNCNCEVVTLFYGGMKLELVWLFQNRQRVRTDWIETQIEL